MQVSPDPTKRPEVGLGAALRQRACDGDGDVVVQGKGQEDGTRVQGLVYTKGSFKAQDSTIVGAVVSAGVDGTTELDRVNMVQVPGVTDFEVVVDKALKELTLGGKSEFEGFYIGVEHQGVFVPFTDSTSLALREVAELLIKQSPPSYGNLQIRKKNDDGSVGEVVDEAGLLKPVRSDGNRRWDLWEDYIDDAVSGSLTREEIFKLDLNSFLSVQGELEVKLWRSYRERNGRS